MRADAHFASNLDKTILRNTHVITDNKSDAHVLDVSGAFYDRISQYRNIISQRYSFQTKGIDFDIVTNRNGFACRDFMTVFYPAMPADKY
jgi:hypothetical protein